MRELSDNECDVLALEIIRKLDGLTISRARWVLHEAEVLLCHTHRVDCSDLDFTVAVEEYQAAGGV